MCIRDSLPYSVAETIYNTVEKNYPVLVYELPGTENTAAADKDAAGTVISLSLIHIFRKANAPAMLVECCFVDDKDDQKIYNAEKMANAIVKGITGLEVGSVSGLSDVQNKDGNWYYYRNGKINTGYTGLAKNKNGWFYVRNGKVDFKRTGLEKNEHGWFYVKNGKVDFGHTCLLYTSRCV